MSEVNSVLVQVGIRPGRFVHKEDIKAAVINGAFFNYEDLIEASADAVTNAVWAVLTK